MLRVKFYGTIEINHTQILQVERKFDNMLQTMMNGFNGKT